MHEYSSTALSPGRSNVVTGVAKTIKTHFKKYPLAIVNIKGRAKGTSAQEVIFELEVCYQALIATHVKKDACSFSSYVSFCTANDWRGTSITRAQQSDFIQRLGGGRDARRQSEEGRSEERVREG